MLKMPHFLDSLGQPHCVNALEVIRTNVLGI